jgi:uncharacterized protein YcnI
MPSSSPAGLPSGRPVALAAKPDGRRRRALVTPDDRRSLPMSRALRLVAAAALVAVVVVATAGPASAHVTVNPREAAKGGFAKLTFRVPNERDDASTTSLAVRLPTDHPLASVSVRPTPGWTAKVERGPLPTPVQTDDGQVTDAVSTITWSGGTIAPGEFQEFDISVGPLPDDADSLTFPAVQTYSSGEVVRWIERAQPGGTEPEHPAPTVRLTDPAGGSASTATTINPGTTAADGQAAPAATATEDDDAATGLAVVALIVGIVGVLTGIGGIAMARRR